MRNIGQQGISFVQTHGQRQYLARLGISLGQQFDARQVLGRAAHAQKLQQVTARAAAHFQQTQFGHVSDALLAEHVQHHALAFLHTQANLGAQKAVAVIMGRAAGVALCNGLGFVQRFHATASMKRRASTGYVWCAST